MRCLEGERDHDVGQQKRTMSCSWVGKEGGRLWCGGLGGARRARLLPTEGRSAGPSTFAPFFCVLPLSCLSSQSSNLIHFVVVIFSLRSMFNRCF